MKFGDGGKWMGERPSAGKLKYRGRRYHLEVAECAWSDGYLFVRALGNRCVFGLASVPFPGVEWINELPGETWEPTSSNDDVLAEGSRFELRGRAFAITGIRLICTRFVAEVGVLSLNLWYTAEEKESGESDVVEGVLPCQVVERGTGRW